MEWQQWFVLCWMQIALISLILLVCTHIACRWIPQPIEKIRLIQLTLATLCAIPVLSFIPIFPSQALSTSLSSVVSKNAATESSNDERPSIKSSENQTWQGSLPSPTSNRLHIKPVDRMDWIAMENVNDSDQVGGSLNANDKPDLSISSKTFRVMLPGAGSDYWLVGTVVLVLLQFIATFLFFIQNQVSARQLRQILRSATQCSEIIENRWRRITMGRAANVRLCLSNEITTPLTFGWNRPVVLLPADLQSIDRLDLDSCLAHEWSHIQRGDSVAWYWANLARYLFWYQPLYWSMRKELRLCQEYLADHSSANSVSDPISYSELLIRLAKRQTGSVTVNALSMLAHSSQLTRRIRFLMESQKPLTERCRTGFTMALLMCAVFFAMSSSQIRFAPVYATRPVISESTTEEKQDDEKSVLAKPPQSISYRSTIRYPRVSNTQLQLEFRSKEIVTEDGRYRSELLGDNIPNPLMSISDKTGASITILTSKKEVLMPAAAFNASHHTWLGLERLRNGLKQADKILGTKELDGKQVSGFRLKQLERTYTVWTDVITGELVQVEYDDPRDVHVTMNQFQLDVVIDESQFDCRIPDGYKESKSRVFAIFSSLSILENAPKNGEAKLHNMSLEWSRPTRANYIKVNADGEQLFLLHPTPIASLNTLDSKNRLLFSYFADAEGIEMADLDGDGEDEIITLKRHSERLAKDSGWKVAAYTNQGLPLWTNLIEFQRPKQSLAMKLVAADLNGDGREEVLLGFSQELVVCGAAGDLQRIPLDLQKFSIFGVADLNGDASTEFLLGTPNGKLKAQDRNGQTTREIDPGFYVTYAKALKPKAGIGGSIIATGRRAEVLACLDFKGATKWSMKTLDRVQGIVECTTKPWIAVAYQGGKVQVIDVVSGKLQANLEVREHLKDIAWMTAPDGAPLLIISQLRKLDAYRINIVADAASVGSNAGSNRSNPRLP